MDLVVMMVADIMQPGKCLLIRFIKIWANLIVWLYI